MPRKELQVTLGFAAPIGTRGDTPASMVGLMSRMV